MDKRTLGGYKKYVFEPKIPTDNEEFSFSSEKNEIEPDLNSKATKTGEISKKEKKTKNVVKIKNPGIIAHSESKKSTNFDQNVIFEDLNVLEEINFSKENEPKLISQNEKAQDINLLDDVLFIFNFGHGFTPKSILLYDDGSICAKNDTEIKKMVKRNVENYLAVEKEEDFVEVGQIAGIFTACKENI
ncbi:hypothetical protein CWI38_0434p0020 [Hamiltosporidium tvaerminnensis]|uniref:Uncharacterized protein n=1 Tax=Hamiltosporidium tvaerminnensis TaxID=1176355 RepID=A0A4Q9LYG7_9MICR|nr:hypothetical protein CWI38_0434p0020 [Hamiltosporidium tvaerminnensis]